MKKLTGVFFAVALGLIFTSIGFASVMWTSTNIKPVVALRYQDPITMGSVLRNYTSSGACFFELHRDNDGDLYISIKAKNKSGMDVRAFGVGSGAASGKGGTFALACKQDNLPVQLFSFGDGMDMQPESVYMTGAYSYNTSNVCKCTITLYATGILNVYGVTTPARVTLTVKLSGLPPELSPYDDISRDLAPPPASPHEPIAVDKSVNLDYGAANTAVDLLAGAQSYQDPPTLDAVIQIPPPNGTLSAVVNGIVTYTPDSGFEGVDVFYFKVTDTEALDSIDHKVTVTVSGKPDAAALVQKVKRDSTANQLDFSSLSLVSGITWVDSVTASGYGSTAKLPNGSFTYTPIPGFTGHHYIDYTIKAASGWTDSGKMDVQVCPVAEPDIASVTKSNGQTVVVNVLNNDIDYSGSVANLEVLEVSNGLHGTAVLSNSNTTITYTVGFTGVSDTEDHLYYVVHDKVNDLTGVGTVTILYK